jgi:hypothetical protein
MSSSMRNPVRVSITNYVRKMGELEVNYLSKAAFIEHLSDVACIFFVANKKG